MDTSLTESWMAHLFPGTPLHDIVMPGSHDAGMTDFEITLNEGRWKSAGATQNLDIQRQLMCGARWFDVRMDLVEGSFKAYHGGKAEKSGSKRKFFSKQSMMLQNYYCSFGESWENMLIGIRSFLNICQNEFVFVRLSKCHGEFWTHLNSWIELIFKGFEHMLLKDFSQNLIDANVHDLRGKCIFLVDDKNALDSTINSSNGIYRLQKLNGHSGTQAKDSKGPLLYCGSYSGSRNIKKILGESMLEATLTKDLIKEMEKVGKGAKTGVTQRGRLAAHYGGTCGGAVNQHLMTLYWTSTGFIPSESNLNVRNNTNHLNDEGRSIENFVKEAKKRIAESKDSLLTQERYQYMKEHLCSHTAKEYFQPNIIMYDFINVAQSLEIIKMNGEDAREWVLDPEIDYKVNDWL
jgi:hypothetical protein